MGANTIKVLVTSQSGVTKTYSIQVTRAGNGNSDLSALSVSAGALSPAFSPDAVFYSLTVPNNVDSTSLTATVGIATAKISITAPNTQGTVSGQAVPVKLITGANSISIVVTAQNGDKKSYTVLVMRDKNSNADLSTIVVAPDTVSPHFTASTMAYTLSLNNNVTSITVKPKTVVAASSFTMIANSVAIDSTNLAAPINLNVGANTIQVTVRAENGTTKVYTLVVTRAMNGDATLSGLSVSSGALDTAFTAADTIYAVSFDNSITSISLTPKKSAATSQIKVNGKTVMSGAASDPISLNVETNPINIVVTAENQSTKTYLIVVTLAKSGTADLNGLTFSPNIGVANFNASTLTYSISVANDVTSAAIILTAASTSSITVNGTAVASGASSAPIVFNVGANTIPIVVKAENGTTKSYTLSVSRNDLPVVSGLNDTTISINDVINFKVNATDAIGGIKWYLWDYNGDGKNEDTSLVNTKSHTFPATAGLVNVIVTVEDNRGGKTKKSIAINVIQDPPIVNVGNDTTILTGHSLAIKGNVKDKYGTVVLLEWSIGGSPYQKTNSLDTTIITPSLETLFYQIVLRATDDDGNVVSDTAFLSLQKAVFEPLGIAGFTTGAANYTSMALNSAGIPYVAFQDVANGSKATVMRFNASTNGWEVVGTAGFSAGLADNTTLAISSSGVPYVAFKDYANSSKLTVMKLNAAGTGWELVGTAGFTGSEVSFPFLALSGTGIPYVTFMDYEYGLKGTVMSFNSISNAWVTVGTPGFSAGRAFNLTLTINSTGVPYVAFSDDGNGNKGMMKKLNAVGTGWDVVGISEFSMGGAFEISLALSSTGVPYVAFEDGAHGTKATVMRLNVSGTGWDVVGVNAFSGSSVYFLSLAFDKTGAPFVAYQDAKIAGRGTVMKLNSAGTGWETVGTAGFSKGTVIWTSLAFNSSGVPYVGFHDAANGGKATVDKIIFAP